MIPEKIIEKVPPQNLEAEEAVLGAMLLDKETIAKAIELLEESAFYSDANSKIFRTIIELYDRNRPVDMVTIVEELSKKNILEEIGGPSYVTELAGAIPTSANFEHYAKIVRDKFLLRELIKAAARIASIGYESDAEAEDILDLAEKEIFDIASEGRRSRNILEMKDIVKESIAVIDKLYQRKENVTGIATGFHELDIMTAGMQKSDFIVVAGRPSMGKSALAASIIEHVGVANKIPCAFFSLEMSREQLAQRMLCSLAKVNAHKLRTGFLSQTDWPELVAAAQKLSESPVYIDDTPGMSVLELRAKARRLAAKYGIQLVIVDYIQLIKGPDRKENRQQEMSEISRAIKALARELNVPVVGISQLSRAPEQREDRRPRLSDLRESGAIEQDADLVLLLFREELYNRTEENRGVADLAIAKQRNGPVGDLKLAFLSEYTKFTNLSRLEEEEGF